MAQASDVSERARELHERAVVIDCHSDILIPIADGFVRMNQDVAPPDPAGWTPPFEIGGESPGFAGWPHDDQFGCIGQYGLPHFRRGGLTAQVCAIFVKDHELDVALRRSLDMVWWLHREVEANDDLELVTTAADIRRLTDGGQVGAVMALEAVEQLGQDVRLLDVFYKLGVRMACLTWNRRNQFADGTQHHVSTGGLTDLGRQAVRRMNELGMIVDVGHINQVGFWETLEITDAPVVLSHRSPRAFFPLKPEDSRFHPAYDVSRGRERLEALAQNGGVFGVFLLGAKDVDDVVDDIEYVIDLVGPDHAGLGSDLYGLHNAPEGLEEIGKVPAITECMVARGHSDEVILKVLGENFMRVFEQVWKG